MSNYALYKGLSGVSGTLSQFFNDLKTQKRYDQLLEKADEKNEKNYQERLLDTLLSNNLNLVQKGQADLYTKKTSAVPNGTAAKGTIVAGKEVGKVGTPKTEMVKEDYIDYGGVLKALKSGDAVIKPNLEVINNKNALKNPNYKLKSFEAKQINDYYGTSYKENDELPVSVVGNYLQGRKANKLQNDKKKGLSDTQIFKELRNIETTLSDPLLKDNAQKNPNLMARYKYLLKLAEINNDENDDINTDINNNAVLMQQAKDILKEQGFDENDENNVKQVMKKLQNQ